MSLLGGRRYATRSHVGPLVSVTGIALLIASPALIGSAFGQTPQPHQPPAPPQNQRITGPTVTIVDVPVLAFDKAGAPVIDLEQSDFRVNDDGLPQKMSDFDKDPRPLSVAIVIDIADADAVGQAKRSAQQIASMLVGDGGEAAVYIPGPEPRQLLPFTSDQDKLTGILTHLQQDFQAPGIIETLNKAMVDIRHQPTDRTRAVLIISKSNAKNSLFMESVIEGAMTDAIPVFRISPNRPRGAPAYVNPIDPREAGTGPGSQRDSPPAAPPIGTKGVTPGLGTTGDASMATLNPVPLIGAMADKVGEVMRGHENDYIFASGGKEYSPASDNDFDIKLSLVGSELRSVYHLFYHPSNLAATDVHTIKVDVINRKDVSDLTYRRTYLAFYAAPQAAH